MAMDFSLHGLLSPQQCYDFLLDVLHPQGLHCPRGHGLEHSTVRHARRAPIVTYECGVCGQRFNAFTHTVLSGIRYTTVKITQLVRGIAQGETTARLAREIRGCRKNVLKWRHKLQQLAKNALSREALNDNAVEADEMYQNAGEKGELHEDPEDPPRRRANKRRGHGTWDNDRPPILGIVGRESGKTHLEVCHHSTRDELIPHVLSNTVAEAVVNTDEWQAYSSLPDRDRGHVTVCHGRREWARDDDGDGVREVHCNTMEGIWTGLRNFLRVFRGVHKEYLSQYVAMFEWSHNEKAVSTGYLRALLGVAA